MYNARHIGTVTVSKSIIQKLTQGRNEKMAKRVYFLSTCNTCNRILDELAELAEAGAEQLETIDIKGAPIKAKDLDFSAQKTGSYEALFNKRAQKYRSEGLNQRELSEADYRELILEEYTFLKRPLFIVGEEVFAGNAKKTVAAVKEALA